MKSHSFEILPRKKQGKPRQTKANQTKTCFTKLWSRDSCAQTKNFACRVTRLRSVTLRVNQKWHAPHRTTEVTLWSPSSLCHTVSLSLYPSTPSFDSFHGRSDVYRWVIAIYMILQTHAKNRCLWIPHEISIDSLWCLYFHTIETPSHTINNSSSDRIQPCAGLQCSVPPQGSTTWMTLSGLRTLQPDFNHETTHIKALFHEVLQQLSLWDSTVQSLSSERLGTRGKLCYYLAAFPCARAAKTVPVRSPSWYQP
jgi:hypothetical protein